MDPWTFAIYWLVFSVACLFIFAVIHDAWQRRAAEPEPVRETVPAAERCMIEHPQKCNEPAATEIHRWRLCADHLAERVCNVFECDNAARHTVTRHGHELRVCGKCHDEGEALGLWDAEVTA